MQTVRCDEDFWIILNLLIIHEKESVFYRCYVYFGGCRTLGLRAGGAGATAIREPQPGGLYLFRNEPLAVTVETSPAQWAAEASASWVKAEPGEDGTTLVLSVEDNDGDAERKAAVTVTAGQASQTITVYQLAPDLSINRFRKERMFQNGGVVSPSGKYIGGFTNKAMEDTIL